jgi:hypothetical protein
MKVVGYWLLLALLFCELPGAQKMNSERIILWIDNHPVVQGEVALCKFSFKGMERDTNNNELMKHCLMRKAEQLVAKKYRIIKDISYDAFVKEWKEIQTTMN